MKSLNQVLKRFTSSCDPAFDEERGGFIIKQIETNKYEGHWITNIHTGTPVARALFTAEANEYGEKILKKVLTGKWEEYASFHTHPIGFGAIPSSIDLDKLFKGFPINYIYSPSLKVLIQYTYNKNQNLWNPKKIQPVLV